ncbi:MAG: PilT protein domain-containing protein [Elusimicrobia bacterium]|nr:MAG: PilT protein domain-containing protein [Elusimicrobiota bacterium]KAF0156044.1 MAG: PilT protein domain-containing protein [Elusimicrobiota bacterium]
MIWIFRAVALLGTPVLTYFQVSRDLKGILFGVAAGLLIIGIEYVLENTSLFTLIVGVIGAVGGLIIAKLLDYAVFQMDNDQLTDVWVKTAPVARYALALLGMIISVKKIPELDELDKNIITAGRKQGRGMKLLDISAIVDGRIVDICETRFITGAVVAPRFVVQELHSLSESKDPIKRAKGRRGLDILARLQESKDVPFRVIDREVREVTDVTMKLARVASELGASIITTDFNVNKIASLENVTALNINDLSMALKPVVLPGEDMQIFVMKEGKEKEQGVGYLDDGTMVVVEDGRDTIGKKVEVMVQSILQTSQGRIIFTRMKSSRPQQEPREE